MARVRVTPLHPFAIVRAQEESRPRCTRRIVASSLAWLLAAAAANAAVYGTVSGTVQDPQHRAIPLAVVTVQGTQSGWKQEAETDQAGRFSMSAVPAGQYALVVTKSGFQPTESALVVRSGTVTQVDVVRSGGAGR